MVKTLLLGLLMCGLACAAPAPTPPPPSPSDLEDQNTRSERSTNLSHITGTSRKIQMYMSKNRHLQLLPDGTVNGTTDDSSAYTILQRMTVGIGKLKIQGVATCQYLCMDSCGQLYGSRVFGDECVFNETMEHNHYNTYSSTKYSNRNRTMYLALNRKGQPRKVLIKAGHPLGTHAVFARVLTRTVSPERIERLHPVRHHAHMCDSPEPAPAKHPRCRKKKKKKKPKCVCDSDTDSDSLQRPSVRRKQSPKFSKKCKNSVECQRLKVTRKNRNNKFGDKPHTKNKKVKHRKHPRVNVSTTTTELPTSTFAVTEEVMLDEDYMVDTTTDWEDTTLSPEDGTFRPD